VGFLIFVRDLPGRFLAFGLEIIGVKISEWYSCKLLGLHRKMNWMIF